MDNYFIINDRLPSLNDYVDACRASKYGSNSLKQNTEAFICAEIHNAKMRKHLQPFRCPVFVRFEWHERTQRRDADNIAFAKKFILDAMQKSGIIPNDSRKYVKGFSEDVIDDKRDFVIVKVYEYGKQ